MKVEVSQNYDKFNFVESNRPVNNDTLARLRDSVKTRNLLHLFPIVVDEDYNILDGQHRFTIAKELNLPLYYVIEPNLTFDLIPMVNSVATRWMMSEYIRHWALEGNECCQQVYAILVKYKLAGATIFPWLKTGKRVGEFRKSIRDGSLATEIPDDIEENLEIAQLVAQDIHAEMGVPLWTSSQFHIAMCSFLESDLVDKDLFLEKWKTQKHRFRAIRDTYEMAKDLALIYSHRSPDKITAVRVRSSIRFYPVTE